MRVSVVRNSSDERSSAWRARRRVEAQEATSSRPASSSRAPMRCARRRARLCPRLRGSRRPGHNRLAALRRRHECPLRDLVGDRPVTGVPDAGPDREGSSGDRPRDLLGVERCQITSRPASSDHNDELRRQGTEPRQGADDLRGRLGSLHCRGFEADVEQVPGPFQLAGEVPVSLRAGTGHEPDTKRHEGQGQPPVRLEEVLASNVLSNRLRAAAIPPIRASTSSAVMEKRSLLPPSQTETVPRTRTTSPGVSSTPTASSSYWMTGQSRAQHATSSVAVGFLAGAGFLAEGTSAAGRSRPSRRSASSR